MASYCWACALRPYLWWAFFAGPRVYDDGHEIFGRYCKRCHRLDESEYVEMFKAPPTEVE